jgi:hypothetical protein
VGRPVRAPERVAVALWMPGTSPGKEEKGKFLDESLNALSTLNGLITESVYKACEAVSE